MLDKSGLPVQNLKLTSLFLAICLIGIPLALSPAQAAPNPALSMDDASTSATHSHLTASLIAEPRAIAAGKSFWVGLHLKMEAGWHVYWKNPGDAGLPVSLDWQLPKGFAAGNLNWPYPMRIMVPPLMNFGYDNEVLLPVEISSPRTLPVDGKIELKAKAKWIVCKDICLPGNADLTLTLPTLGAGTQSESPSPSGNSANATLFQNARLALPVKNAAWKFTAMSVDSAIFILAKPSGSITLSALSFFPENPDWMENAAQQNFFPIQGGYALELHRVPPEPDATGKSGGLDSLIGVLVSETGWGSAEEGKAVQICLPIHTGKERPHALSVTLPPTGQSNTKQLSISPSLSSGMNNSQNSDKRQSGWTRLTFMLGLAFLGGLILNLMPCVLPVLSLKIFDFVKRAGQSRWKVFSHGLTFTAGVLVSFWFLAGLLLILRSGGRELGWGFQLQSPGFLIVLCALFFFFSLNLFGVFELGMIFTRIGSTKTQSGHAGSFFAGVTATVVATPCTAPFMGSAMGYAFSQPAYYAMLVFTFLGLGMAAPYLLLSGFPGMMRFLPKPGEWMEHLKQFMGFPLLATAIWLAWVLGHQAGVDALVALLFILLLAGMSAWILGKWTALHRTTPVRIIAGLIALVIFMPAFVLVLIYLDQIRSTHPEKATPTGEYMPQNEGSIDWKPFSETELTASLASGKPVFVDFTADWCLSCKVNERVAFSSREVTDRLRDLGMVMLKADWTSRNETISRALSNYGRNSIPLYVLYGGHGPKDFALLPEILSPNILLEALRTVIPNSKPQTQDSGQVL